MADIEYFDVEIDLPRFLNSVLEKDEYICQRNVERKIVEKHIVVVDHTVSLLRSLRDSRSIMDTADKEILSDLSSAFNDVFCATQQSLANVSLSLTSAAQNICPKLSSVEPGRPAFEISAELLEDLLGLGFSHTKIAEYILGVSCGPYQKGSTLTAWMSLRRFVS